jgi:hypothetical protein
MLKAIAIWTALVILAWVGGYLLVQDQEGSLIILVVAIVAGVPIWIAGIVVISILVAARTPTQRIGPRTVCTNCGHDLYQQWWSKAKGVYNCQSCGQATAGRVVEETPQVAD